MAGKILVTSPLAQGLMGKKWRQSRDSSAYGNRSVRDHLDPVCRRLAA